LNTIEIKKTHTKKIPTTATVIAVVPDEVDDNGNKLKSGTVKFINDVGSTCVMTTNQFHEAY
tara:strand:- start:10873 stop:11058 length:186 start_codon:yes stop_codon:yes gene_type:complete